jgi:hypothetical protein
MIGIIGLIIWATVFVCLLLWAHSPYTDGR